MFEYYSELIGLERFNWLGGLGVSADMGIWVFKWVVLVWVFQCPRCFRYFNGLVDLGSFHGLNSFGYFSGLCAFACYNELVVRVVSNLIFSA